MMSIHVDESDPIGEVELSFPPRDVQIKRGLDPKEFYDLELELGRGKFGTVYRCKEKSGKLQLAAKFVSVPKKEDRRNVEREVEIMRELQHPRLLQLYDAFENGKVMCLILELIEGGELFERVIDDDFVLTEKSCTVFMRQICEGIAFIHKQKILHLDMKPENILCLTKTGNRIKIIDFGLARKYDPNKKLQVLFGTPEFVAPEVVNFDQIGYGTDMWSVGVICYVLLSGLSPFMGHTDVETMANVTIAKYDFDDEAFEEITDGAKDFIRRLLIKDMSARLTAEECLSHQWLRRKEPQKSPSTMEMAKDNLKQFVERWNEHPNSPYVFEMTCSMRRNTSLESLSGLSPSPCESIISADSDLYTLITNESPDSLGVPSLDPFRRASDSNYVVRNGSISERVNLAEEIRKLSDKLFQLSNLAKAEKPIDVPQLNHSTDAAPATEPIEVPRKGSFPSKFRVSSFSRDVPMDQQPNFAAKINTSPSSKEYFHSRLSIFERRRNSSDSSSSPGGTKNLLLKLLGRWDGSQTPPPTQRGKSHSICDWSECDYLGQRTISSLNSFFQSRATSKKITKFHQADVVEQNLLP